MKQLLLFCICLIGLSTPACMDPRTVLDSNVRIAGENWSYTEKVRIPIEITDDSLSYNVALNLRHTSQYKYSNIFLLIHLIGPDGKRITERKEFQLALPDGEWLGSGSGDMYSYQIPFWENRRLPKGKYTVELEQNMRDNPLDHVTDAGIRVEKAR